MGKEIYLIHFESKENYNAGYKAPFDIYKILSSKISILSAKDFTIKAGFKNIFFNFRNINKLIRLINSKEPDSWFIFQYPQFGSLPLFYWNCRIFLLRRMKKFKFTAVIHDLSGYRYKNFFYSFLDFLTFHQCHIIISHNRKMTSYLRSNLFLKKKKFINIEIFDYLTEISSIPHRTFSPTVVFAGNLSKSEFIYSLNEINGIKFNLYGKYDEKRPIILNNVIYKGIFPSNQLPSCLEGSFGLIWDGNSVDSCNGELGRYLRINNPHKLSLYIVAQIPVITWKFAAIADFINENQIGFTVSSLREIPDKLSRLTLDDYNNMYRNTIALSDKLKSGSMILSCLDRISNLKEK